MKVQAFVLSAAAFCLLADAPPSKLKLGDAVPVFALSGIDGKSHKSNDLKGPTVVVFLSTQCPYVIASEGRINDLAKAYKGKVTFVGINGNDVEGYPKESLEAMKAHAKQQGYVFPYLKDESQDATRAFGAIATPDFFVFDKGKLVYRGRMDDNTSPKKNAPITQRDLKDALDALLVGKSISSDQKPSRGCSIKWKKTA